MAQCICCGEVVQLPDLADSAADVCINCFGGGDEDLEAVRQNVDKNKLNKKPAQVAGKKMAGKGAKKKASASKTAEASKETASASNRAAGC